MARSLEGDGRRSKSNPRPSSGSRSRAGSSPLGTTVPRPFKLSTDARGQWTKEHVSKPTVQEEVEYIPFKAREVPSSLYEPEKFDRPTPKKLTEASHFSLRSDTLHREAQNNKKKLLEEQISREEAARVFTARPLPKTTQVPYVPIKDPHEPVIAEPIMLSSEQRAEERAAFEEYLREKEQLKQREKEEELRQQMEKDQAEVAELRLSQQFKAKKMPDFSKPWTPEPSPQRQQRSDSASRVRLSADEKEHRKSLEFKSRPMPAFEKVWDPRSPNRRSSLINTGVGPGEKRQSLVNSPVSTSSSAYSGEISSNIRNTKSASAAAGRQWAAASVRPTSVISPGTGKANLLEKAMAKERARRASLKLANKEKSVSGDGSAVGSENGSEGTEQQAKQEVPSKGGWFS